MKHKTEKIARENRVTETDLEQVETETVTNSDVAHRLANLMVVANRTFMLDLHRKLKEMGMSYQHYHLLGYLEGDQLPIMREISEKLNVSDAAVTQIVDTLEKGGWARRIPHVDDRRKIAVEITMEGRGVLGEIRETIQELIGQAMQARDDGKNKAANLIFAELREMIESV